MTTLKAYEVREDGEGYCTIAFATNGAAARREGASKLGTDWESIESCTRKPEFDSYAPGPVPAMVLLDYGWWFECSECGRRVSKDDDEAVEDYDLDDALKPRSDGERGIFCSTHCEVTHFTHRQANIAAQAALFELVEAKFPFVTVTDVHVYGDKLEPSPHGYGICCRASFTFPGAKYTGCYIFGEAHVHLLECDVAAWHAAKQEATKCAT